MVKHPGPTEAQIEAARKLREKSPAPVPAKPFAPVVAGALKPSAPHVLGLKPAAPKVASAVVVDPDPHPTPPTWSGKDVDFPAWVQADMRYKEAYSAWMARKRKT